MNLKRVVYSNLNARQKENYNFQKLSAVLAEYGYVTFRLSDDWNGADLIAVHNDRGSGPDTDDVLRIQLKGRLTFNKKYLDKNLYVAFAVDGEWYLYPHDELLGKVLEVTTVASTRSWTEKGGYSFPSLSPPLQELLKAYRVEGDARPLPIEDND